jgi:hypothetical protein
MIKISSTWTKYLCSRGCLYGPVGLFSLAIASCATVSPVGPGSGSEQVHHSLLVAAPLNFEIALKENQAALASSKIAPDVALYNGGFLWAHPSNPKKDYTKAIHSFQALVNEHPRSSLLEPAKTWIVVLDQQQKIGDERRKLAEEKRALDKEREILAQERQKLNYANEKSRQLDLEIEKRRRQTLSK